MMDALRRFLPLVVFPFTTDELNEKSRTARPPPGEGAGGGETGKQAAAPRAACPARYCADAR